MFDVLLALLEKNQVNLIEIFLKERKEKGEGLFTIIQDGNKADIRYYSPDKIPYDDISKEYNEKLKDITGNTADKIKVNDKWIITLPILQIETDKDTVIPIWNLVLDDGDNHVFFQGFPQEVDLKNGESGLQYVLVGEPHDATVAKNNWTVEATTNGQKYLQKCLDSSLSYSLFMTFRSDSSFCKIIIPGKKEDGDFILQRVSNDSDIKNNFDKIKLNDKIGSPMVYNYKNYGYFSPGTLKHVNTFYELKEHFGYMKNWNILEFGGGYGGLCHILSYFVKWNKYYFVEIKEPLELVKKCFMYIESLSQDSGICWKPQDNILNETDETKNNVICLLPEEVNENTKYDLFISEFGFCELNEKGIEKYMFILENSINAYLSMNLWDKHKKKTLKDKLLTMFKTVEEYPVFLKSDWGDYVWICKK
jgi:putative sugar O-methyltransferase